MVVFDGSWTVHSSVALSTNDNLGGTHPVSQSNHPLSGQFGAPGTFHFKDEIYGDEANPPVPPLRNTTTVNITVAVSSRLDYQVLSVLCLWRHHCCNCHTFKSDPPYSVSHLLNHALWAPCIFLGMGLAYSRRIPSSPALANLSKLISNPLFPASLNTKSTSRGRRL